MNIRLNLFRANHCYIVIDLVNITESVPIMAPIIMLLEEVKAGAIRLRSSTMTAHLKRKPIKTGKSKCK